MQIEQNAKIPKYKHDKIQSCQNTNVAKYKCNQIQMEQNTNSKNTKIQPPYRPPP